jgi:predicted CoA-binding protein
METKKTVAIGLSRKNFSQRIKVTKFVIGQGYIPIYPGIAQDWWPVERKKNELKNDIEDIIKRADEFWVFGIISEELLTNIKLAKKLRKPIRYFELDNEIREIEENEARFEEGFRKK